MCHINFDQTFYLLLFRQDANNKTAFFVYLSFVFVVTVIVITFIGVITIEAELKISSFFQQFLSDKQTEVTFSINDVERPVSSSPKKLVCYYAAPSSLKQSNQLYPNRIGNDFVLPFSHFNYFSSIFYLSDPFLCTHVNIGIVLIKDHRIVIDDILDSIINETYILKRSNEQLKILFWIGGPAESVEFIEMIKTHANRMEFVDSVMHTLRKYKLDGIDLDWEFPNTYNKGRRHFTKLLHDIRKAFQQGGNEYLLSVAVAALEGIAYFAYDIQVINQYCDYVNVMVSIIVCWIDSIKIVEFVLNNIQFFYRATIITFIPRMHLSLVRCFFARYFRPRH